MFFDDALIWANPIQMVTPVLLLIALVSLVVLVLPSNFLERLAGRLEGAGMIGIGAMFAFALVLVDVISPGGAAGIASF